MLVDHMLRYCKPDAGSVALGGEVQAKDFVQ